MYYVVFNVVYLPIGPSTCYSVTVTMPIAQQNSYDTEIETKMIKSYRNAEYQTHEFETGDIIRCAVQFETLGAF